MARIDSILNPDLTVHDALIKMADGNPGAITVLIQLAKEDIILVLMLDELEIYGADIWRLFKDDCGEDLTKLADEIIRRTGEKNDWRL